MTVFKSITVFFLVAILFFILVSCSGSSKDRKSPIEPDLHISESPTLSEYDDAYGHAPIESALLYDSPISDYITHSVGANILGAFELTIDVDSMSADLIPKRKSAIGESWIVSGKSFFDMSPCTDCFKINGLGYDDGRIVIQFGIRHPFEKGDRESDPSAKNRLDLDIFDLAMVVIPIPLETIDYPTMSIAIPNYSIHNPDGYTNEFSGAYGSAIALPYVLVIDDSRDDPPSNTYNRFEMGASTEFQAEFPVTPGQTLSFDLYLTFGYGFSAVLEDRLEPKYFNPEFNRKAAWKVEVIPPNGDEEHERLNTWDDTDNSTKYDVAVKVYDWQIGANVNPDLEEPSDIYAASEVLSVSVQIPGMTNYPKSVYGNMHVPGGTGMPDSPLVYKIPVANENLIAIGEYTGLVAVYDQRNPLSVADGRDYLIHTPDGGKSYMEFEIPSYVYVTYQTFTATVVEYICGPITGEILSPSCPVVDLHNRSTIDFIVSASSEKGGDPVVLYEVDYDYDGVTFNTHDSNTDGIFEKTGPFIVPYPCWDNIPYTFTVAFRATDSCDPPNVTVFATCDIVVENCPSGGDLIWAKNTGCARAYGVTNLSDDSVAVTGAFYYDVVFGEGEPNETVLTSEGYGNVFIARYNQYGNLQWAKREGTGSSTSSSSITSLSDDSTVITGTFNEKATFGEGEPNETVLYTPVRDSDIFIAHHKPDGILEWVKRAGGEGSIFSSAITALSDNSIVITGSFSRTVVFGIGEQNRTSLTSQGFENFFIARFNSSGKLIWAAQATGARSIRGNHITTLSDNSTVVTGYFSQTATFGEGEPNETILTSAAVYGRNIFIARYNPDGTLAWARKAGGAFFDVGHGITTLSDDSVVVTGVLGSYRAVFGEGEPNETVLYSYGGNDTPFVARYSPDGTFVWAKNIPGPGTSRSYGITTLSDDSAVLIGFFHYKITFNVDGPNTIELIPPNKAGKFIARINSDGIFQWAKQASFHAYPGYLFTHHGITSLSDNSTVAVGRFDGTITFGPDEPNETILFRRNTNLHPKVDLFVARFEP